MLDGKFVRGCIRLQETESRSDGNPCTLKIQDDVKEAATGYECGLVFEKFNDGLRNLDR